MADYEGSYSQTTTTTTTHGGVGVNADYIKTVQGILKIVEIVLGIIVAICAGVNIYFATSGGGGFVSFVGILGLLVAAAVLGLNILNLLPKIPPRIPTPLIIFIAYCVCAGFYLISFIICAARGGWHSSVAAAAFFTFVATGVFGVDTFFQFRVWQTAQRDGGAVIGGEGGAYGGSRDSHVESHTTTTTTTTHVEKGWQQY